MRRAPLTVGLVALVGIAIAIAPRLQPGPQTPDNPAADIAPQQATSVVVEPAAAAENPEGAALVELVFVLDTTGSMRDLIEGAKDTIWSVTNDFSSQTPQPTLRVGIIGYRDRGDTYVTRALPLTEDLDEVYGFLHGLKADGGGDNPESLAKAMIEAVEDQQWTTERDRVYRSIFVVGDAPDKRYQDEKSTQQVTELARGRDIYVSAIQCGKNASAQTEFAAIAAVGAGVFSAVAQSGAVERITTPMDAELDALERELSRTAMPWGSRAEKGVVDQKVAWSRGSSAPSKASRLSALSKGGGKLVTKGSYGSKGDLLDDLEDGSADLEAIPAEELPDALKDLTPTQVEAEVAKLAAKRTELKSEVAATVAKRDGWLAAERHRRARAGDEERYDRMVVEGSIEKLRELGYIE